MAGSLLILGAGYVGAAIAARALDEGRQVVLADNWFATRREELAGLEARGARVFTADVRSREDLTGLLEWQPERVIFTAAQASRPLSFEDPEYTESTNLVGPRIVCEAVAAAGGADVVYASSLHVYGGGLTGEVGADRPYGPQGDLAHLSKVYAELLLRMEAGRHGFGLSLLRLGIVYGPGPVMHTRPESVTVIDKFRRLAARGEPLPLDDGGLATIGAVHVDDAARILLEAREPAGGATWTVASPFRYEHDVASYLRSAA